MLQQLLEKHLDLDRIVPHTHNLRTYGTSENEQSRPHNFCTSENKQSLFTQFIDILNTKTQDCRLDQSCDSGSHRQNRRTTFCTLDQSCDSESQIDKTQDSILDQSCDSGVKFRQNTRLYTRPIL